MLSNNKKCANNSLTADIARKLFYYYHGNYYYMAHEGELDKYKSYHISSKIETKWALEFLSERLKKMYASDNMQIIHDLLWEYGEMACNYGDYNALESLVEFSKRRSNNLDTFTLNMGAQAVISISTALCRQRKTPKLLSDLSHLSQEMLDLLKKNLERGISVSEDYRKNGILPDYLSKDKLEERVKSSLSKLEAIKESQYS